MTKNEVIDLLESIDQCYPGRLKWDKPQELIMEWTKKLEKYDAEMIQENFLAHVETSAYLPTLSDLIRKAPAGKVVPSFQETRDFLKRYDTPAPVTEEVREAEREKIRKILGIE